MDHGVDTIACADLREHTADVVLTVDSDRPAVRPGVLRAGAGWRRGPDGARLAARADLALRPRGGVCIRLLLGDMPRRFIVESIPDQKSHGRAQEWTGWALPAAQLLTEVQVPVHVTQLDDALGLSAEHVDDALIGCLGASLSLIPDHLELIAERGILIEQTADSPFEDGDFRRIVSGPGHGVLVRRASPESLADPAGQLGHRCSHRLTDDFNGFPCHRGGDGDGHGIGHRNSSPRWRVGGYRQVRGQLVALCRKSALRTGNKRPELIGAPESL